MHRDARRSKWLQNVYEQALCIRADLPRGMHKRCDAHLQPTNPTTSQRSFSAHVENDLLEKTEILLQGEAVSAVASHDLLPYPCLNNFMALSRATRNVPCRRILDTTEMYGSPSLIGTSRGHQGIVDSWFPHGGGQSLQRRGMSCSFCR